MINHETMILATVGAELLPSTGAFPQWPCLRLNAEKIWAAIQDGELSYGRDGKTVPAGETVRKDRITVKHTDLKTWMQKTYPDQKPNFLFDDVERSTHTAINADSFRTLQADRDALNARIEKAEELAKEAIAKRKYLEGEIATLTRQVNDGEPLSTKERNTLLTIIALLCKEAKLDYTMPAKTAHLLLSTATEMGVSIGETTIEGHLKKVTNALGTRMN